MRLTTADRLKGLCIALMIVGHCQIAGGLHDFIYLFHIPLFFFVSGFFMKAGSLKEKTVLDVRRLLVPYLVGVALVSLKYGIDAFRLHDSSSIVRYWISALVVGPGIDIGNWKDLMVGPIWFLAALFFGRFLMNVFFKVRRGELIVLLIGLGVCSLPCGNVLPFGLQQGAAALAFMGLGNALAKHPETLGKAWMWPISIALMVPAFFIPSLDMYLGLYPIPVVNGLASFGAVVFLWKLFYLMENVRFPVLDVLGFFGRISLLVLLVHYYEAMTFDWYGKLGAVPGWGIPLVRLAIDLIGAALLYKIPVVRKVLCLK